MEKIVNNYSYKYNEFMSYQEINNVLPKSLLVYCTKNYDHKLPQINNFADQLNEIITIITKGDDPNDLIFKNKIKFYTNTIGQNNYDEYLQQLKKINYNSKSNVQFLISELIKCSIICKVSFTGYNLEEKEQFKQVPEVCADILKQLCSLQINSTTEEISFYNEILYICHQYFTSYIDPKKSMDEHNTYNADNYKGFMTFMGLLYERGILSNKIIVDCLRIIKEIIFSSENKDNLICIRDNVECSNFYKGYEHLLNHFLYSLKIRIPEILKIYKEKEKMLFGITELIKKINENKNDYINNLNENLDNLVAEKTFCEIFTKLNKNNFTENELKKLNIRDNIILKSSNELKYYLQNDEIFKKIVINILENENNILHSVCENIEQTINKTIISFNCCVDYHQEIKNLNGKFLSYDSKKNLTSPLRKYMVITHDMQGENINKLVNYFTHIQNDLFKNTQIEIKKYSKV
jgi:hypothetical protein